MMCIACVACLDTLSDLRTDMTSPINLGFLSVLLFICDPTSSLYVKDYLNEFNIAKALFSRLINKAWYDV